MVDRIVLHRFANKYTLNVVAYRQLHIFIPKYHRKAMAPVPQRAIIFEVPKRRALPGNVASELRI